MLCQKRSMPVSSAMTNVAIPASNTSSACKEITEALKNGKQITVKHMRNSVPSLDPHTQIRDACNMFRPVAKSPPSTLKNNPSVAFSSRCLLSDSQSTNNSPLTKNIRMRISSATPEKQLSRAVEEQRGYFAMGHSRTIFSTSTLSGGSVRSGSSEFSAPVKQGNEMLCEFTPAADFFFPEGSLLVSRPDIGSDSEAESCPSLLSELFDNESGRNSTDVDDNGSMDGYRRRGQNCASLQTRPRVSFAEPLITLIVRRCEQ